MTKVNTTDSKSIVELKKIVQDNRDIVCGLAHQAHQLQQKSSQTSGSLPDAESVSPLANRLSLVPSIRFTFDKEITACRPYQYAIRRRCSSTRYVTFSPSPLSPRPSVDNDLSQSFPQAEGGGPRRLAFTHDELPPMNNINNDSSGADATYDIHQATTCMQQPFETKHNPVPMATSDLIQAGKRENVITTMRRPPQLDNLYRMFYFRKTNADWIGCTMCAKHAAHG